MARVKLLIADLPTRSLKLNIDMAVGCLQDGLYNLEDTESENYRKIIFLIEHLKLLAKHKKGRHYIL